jgi:hypothetical protein
MDRRRRSGVGSVRENPRERFWPGQSRQLRTRLHGPKRLTA